MERNRFCEEEIKLVKPEKVSIDAIFEFSKELLETQDMDKFAGCSGLNKYPDIESWLVYVDLLRSENTCPLGKVPSDVYFAIRKTDSKLLGVIDLRRSIDTPILNEYAGHIGYSIRPSERRKGYAKEMLRLALGKYKTNGYENILISCRVGNIGSEKVILANGGKFDVTVETKQGVFKKYWISL